MERYDLIVVGAGPAGLSAAIEAAKRNLKVIVFDENARPGGQLFKQIHKFFGSKEHKAKIRGYRIGQELLEESEQCGVRVVLNATVIGIYDEDEVAVRIEDRIEHVHGDVILVATGASEKMVMFPGWTTPGVIGAGAAQTMMNLHYVKPGSRILMLGTGNVGLVVSYQLIQAGCEVVAVVDAAPRVGGYGVHASKIARMGVPFYLSHTIKEVEGTDHVTGVTIGEVDPSFNIIEGTEKHFDVDTVCLAVGLSPMSQLLKQAGCQMQDTRGGYLPVCDENGKTSVDSIYVAGDVSGIEEASSAMIKGRISGLAIAERLGFTSDAEAADGIAEMKKSLSELRKGMFAPENRGREIKTTDEGIEVSQTLLKKGYVADSEIGRFPGAFSGIAKVHPVIECTQNIPCNPCQDACTRGCIKIGSDITALPVVDRDSTCINCGMCVASCSGQAIFLVNEEYEKGFASVTIPYELFPLPESGDKGKALDRSGAVVCDAEILSVKSSPAYDNTNLLTMKVPADMAMKARFYKR